MPLVTVADARRELSEEHYRELEAGEILFLPQTPIVFSDAERSFLLTQRQSEAGHHKNIAGRPLTWHAGQQNYFSGRIS